MRGDVGEVGGKARCAVERKVAAAFEFAYTIVAPRFAVSAPAQIEQTVQAVGGVTRVDTVVQGAVGASKPTAMPRDSQFQ